MEEKEIYFPSIIICSLERRYDQVHLKGVNVMMTFWVVFSVQHLTYFDLH